MDLDSIQDALANHVAREILLRKEPLGPDEDLFDAGFDSLSLSRTLVFVEERFGLAIPESEVDVDEISTISKMARFVDEKLRAHAG